MKFNRIVATVCLAGMLVGVLAATLSPTFSPAAAPVAPAKTDPATSLRAQLSIERKRHARQVRWLRNRHDHTYSSNRALVKALAESIRGWRGVQWTCLDTLLKGEANYNHRARNRSSGAYGIPQALPGRKMATVAADWATNPATQALWALRYVRGRYGTPCGALAAWRSRSPHWY